MCLLKVEKGALIIWKRTKINLQDNKVLLCACKLQRGISNLYDGTFWGNCKKMEAIHYFRKTLHHRRLVGP